MQSRVCFCDSLFGLIFPLLHPLFMITELYSCIGLVSHLVLGQSSIRCLCGVFVLLLKVYRRYIHGSLKCTDIWLVVQLHPEWDISQSLTFTWILLLIDAKNAHKSDSIGRSLLLHLGAFTVDASHTVGAERCPGGFSVFPRHDSRLSIAIEWPLVILSHNWSWKRRQRTACSGTSPRCTLPSMHSTNAGRPCPLTTPENNKSKDNKSCPINEWISIERGERMLWLACSKVPCQLGCFFNRASAAPECTQGLPYQMEYFSSRLLHTFFSFLFCYPLPTPFLKICIFLYLPLSYKIIKNFKWFKWQCKSTMPFEFSTCSLAWRHHICCLIQAHLHLENKKNLVSIIFTHVYLATIGSLLVRPTSSQEYLSDIWMK